MNKDKVYLEGYVVGHAADTLGYKGLLVQLENLDIVEIDENLVHKDINKPQPIKLKDVIARIKGFDSGTQKVWLNEILNELGSDYGTLKYKDGYEQGKVEGLIEHEKVVVPQFVADWYEEHKDNLEYNIWDWMKYNLEPKKRENVIFSQWLGKTVNNPAETLIKMKLYGYEVEKEKRYLVKMKGVDSKTNYLYYGMGSNTWSFRMKNESGYFRRNHTRKELEEAGFGEVFNSPLFEVEEVE